MPEVVDIKPIVEPKPTQVGQLAIALFLSTVLGVLLVYITFALVHKFTAEAFGSILAAFGTLVLAYFTWRSVEQGRSSLENNAKLLTNNEKMLENDRTKFQVENTTRLMDDYLQTQIYGSEDDVFPAHIAASKIIDAGNHRGLVELNKTRLAEIPTQLVTLATELQLLGGSVLTPPNESLIQSLSQFRSSLINERETREKNEAALGNSVAIFDNFFKNAQHLLAQHLLYEPLFKSAFAITYLETLASMAKLGDLLPVRLGNEEIHSQLKAYFEPYIQEHEASRMLGTFRDYAKGSSDVEVSPADTPAADGDE